MKIIRKVLLVFVLFALPLACVSPANNIDPLGPNFINTAVAGTSAAAATQTARARGFVSVVESPTPTLTRPPSATPFPTYTPVVLGMFKPMVQVSKNTNCRSGPGELYDRVGALRVGEAAEVVGRSADAKYWIIRNPNHPDRFCWLSSKYASVTGTAGALPIFTAPPPPTATKTPTRPPRPTNTSVPPTVPSTPGITIPPPPGFVASYHHLDNCPGVGWWADIRLQNTGSVAFESISIGARDTVTGAFVTLISDDFIDRNGCGAPETQDILPAGGARFVSTPAFVDDITGHELQVAIELCTEPGQNGTCITQMITFTPAP